MSDRDAVGRNLANMARTLEWHDEVLQQQGEDILPMIGGTWSGKCGAMHYFKGAPDEMQRTTSGWAERSQHAAIRTLIPGYWAICLLPRNHQLSHEGAGQKWHRTDLDAIAIDAGDWATN